MGAAFVFHGVWGLVLAVLVGVLALAGVIVFLVRYLSARRREKQAATGTQRSLRNDPSPDYPQYDPRNPRFENGYQWNGTGWVLVQYFNSSDRQWYVPSTAGPRPVGRPVFAKASPRRTRAMLIGTVASAVILVLAVTSAGITFNSSGPNGELTPWQVNTPAALGFSWTDVTTAEKNAAPQDAYVLTKGVTIAPQTALNEKFNVSTKRWGAVDTDSHNADEPAVVYTDSTLKSVADYGVSNYTAISANTLTYSPGKPFIDSQSGFHDLYKGRGNIWAPAKTLYFARYVDADGHKLKKPVVTPFTVDTSGFLDAPTVQYTIDAQGYVSLTWNKVPGAAKYEVIYSDVAILDQDQNTWMHVVATTPATSWTSRGKDTSGQSGIQNDAFASLDENTDGDKAISTAFAVLALPPTGSDTDASFLNFADATDNVARIPRTVDFGGTGIDGVYSSVAGLPHRIRVTSISGADEWYGIKLTRYDSADNAYEYSVPGTTFTGEILLDDDHDWSKLKAQAATQIDSVTSTGAKPQQTEDPSTAQFDGYSALAVSKTAPKAPYPAPGFGDRFSAYLAANLVAGNRAISMSGYDDAWNSDPSVIYELEQQDPYILGVEAFTNTVSGDTPVLWVKYDMTTAEIAQQQQKLKQKSAAVIASTITSGMSDEQKAKALNDYLDRAASYNETAYDADTSLSATTGDQADVPYRPAYRDAWTAAGVLLDGTGVCQSYASAYKLLSDAAGLKTVTVTGTADGEGHAWDKTYMGGKWQVVDPTWNDDATDPDGLFGITDKVATGAYGHQQDDTGQWVPARQVAYYAAN